MNTRYDIGLARPADVPRLAAIELAAAQLLRGHAPEDVLAEATSEEDLEAARRDDCLWVALAADVPVGFAHVKLLEPNVAHLNELDVHPDHGRQGLGTRLVNAVGAWAWGRGYESVTLSTFRDVPWNMPFYARLGFVEVPVGTLTLALKAVVADEVRRGLDPERRVVMRWQRRA
jgi:GNAT superfamily N-acetyltransferase